MAAMKNDPLKDIKYPISKKLMAAGIYGLCIGGAVGASAEFTGREPLALKPVEDMDGNGSLMQMLSLGYELYFYCGEQLTAHSEAMERIHRIFGRKHRHPIAMSACGIYLCVAAKLLAGKRLHTAIGEGVAEALAWYGGQPAFCEALAGWDRLKDMDSFAKLPEDEIGSGGYGVGTLEAALWCLLNTDHYRACVLKAANPGSGTHTAAAAAGGLAGLAYGWEAGRGIPKEWYDALRTKDVIDPAAAALWERYGADESGLPLGTFNPRSAMDCFAKAFGADPLARNVFYEFYVHGKVRCTLICENWPDKDEPYALDVSVDNKDRGTMLSCGVNRFVTLEEMFAFIESGEGQKLLRGYVHMLWEHVLDMD